MRFAIILMVLGVAILALAPTVPASRLNLGTGFSGAPPIGGYPGEMNCGSGSGCHDSGGLNLNGQIEILGLPDQYAPGQTYTLTVRLTSQMTAGDTQRRWGFQITAARLDNGERAGDFDAGSQIEQEDEGTFGYREYVSHSIAGLKLGASSPVSWSLNWTAPDESVGQVGFYVSGVAANGDMWHLNDYAYAGADTTEVDPTPVEPTTWSWIKGRLLSGR